MKTTVLAIAIATTFLTGGARPGVAQSPTKLALVGGMLLMATRCRQYITRLY
jgi:hypothetical protein